MALGSIGSNAFLLFINKQSLFEKKGVAGEVGIV
jgi:hypothetical protein